MAHIILRPVVNNPPNIVGFNYPITQLNPQARENIFIGRKIHDILDYKKYKNLAITAVALGCIFLVGSMIAMSFSQLTLSSVLTYGGLTSATAGSGYLVMTHFLNPLTKIESQREKMRFLPLERVLVKSLEDIEGYDLLKRAIEDKTSDPKEKVKTYSCLRQIKRNLENLNLLKKRYEKNVQAQYLTRVENLKLWKGQELRAIYAANPRLPAQVIESDIAEVDRLYNEALEDWQDWKKESNGAINEQYRTAVDQLELQYRSVLGKLGEKPISRWFFWR